MSYQDISQSLTGLVRRGGPQWKLNGGLRADWDNGLNGEAIVHFVGTADYPISESFTTFSTLPGGLPAPDERVGNYTLLNLRGGYRFWNDKAELAISAFNALNEKHKEHPLGETIQKPNFRLADHSVTIGESSITSFLRIKEVRQGELQKPNICDTEFFIRIRYCQKGSKSPTFINFLIGGL